MAYVDPGERQAVVTELAKVIQIIEDPDQRRTFLEDPNGTLEKQGVDVGIVPRQVVDTLGGLSFDELGLISRVSGDFASAGLALGEYERGGRVCFF